LQALQGGLPQDLLQVLQEVYSTEGALERPSKLARSELSRVQLPVALQLKRPNLGAKLVYLVRDGQKVYSLMALRVVRHQRSKEVNFDMDFTQVPLQLGFQAA